MPDDSVFAKHRGDWLYAGDLILPRGWTRLKINPSALDRMNINQILQVLNNSETETFWVESSDSRRECFHALLVRQDGIDHLVYAESKMSREAMVFHSCPGICGSSRNLLYNVQ